MQYYGTCMFPEANGKKVSTNRTVDLTTGTTMFIELGTPLMSTWEDDNNATVPYTDQDLESLRVIARQYNNFRGGAILLTHDNQWAHQYIRTFKSNRIRHIDFDMAYPQPTPASNEILELNCNILLGKLSGLRQNDTRLNCTEEYSRQAGLLQVAS